MRTLLKVFFWLLVFGIVLSIAWPQSAREKAADAIAHSICSQQPPPEVCQP